MSLNNDFNRGTGLSAASCVIKAWRRNKEPQILVAVAEFIPDMTFDNIWAEWWALHLALFILKLLMQDGYVHQLEIPIHDIDVFRGSVVDCM